MPIYKITIKNKTEFIGNIKANTLLGAFCHACSLKYKSNNIEKYIRDVVFSDLFLDENYPIGISNNNTQYKKNNYLNLQKCEVTRTLIHRDNEENNVINVLTGTYSNHNFVFFIYSKELFDEIEINKIIELMLKFGIGKWRNVGKGQFSLVNLENYTNQYISNINNSKKLVALSDFQTNNQNEIKNIIEIGYTIRNARATNGTEQQQQLLLKTGTTFNNNMENTNMILITSGNHIFDKNSRTYIHSKAILIGV